ncbi:MAG: hypothetical protein ACK4TL_18500 [Hyphomicrobiaceae bacterium]
MSRTETVEVLVGFHFHDGIGISYAGAGDHVGVPVELVDNLVSVGRVRRLAASGRTSPAPAAPAPQPPAASEPEPGKQKPGRAAKAQRAR